MSQGSHERQPCACDAATPAQSEREPPKLCRTLMADCTSTTEAMLVISFASFARMKRCYVRALQIKACTHARGNRSHFATASRTASVHGPPHPGASRTARRSSGSCLPSPKVQRGSRRAAWLKTCAAWLKRCPNTLGDSGAEAGADL